MKKIFAYFQSKNGIMFHHVISTFEDNHPNVMEPETHATFEILLLLSGSIEYSIDGRHYGISPMDIIIIPPHKLHTLTADVSKPYERIVLQFDPELLPTCSDVDFLAPFADTYIIPSEFTKQSRILDLFQDCEQHCIEKSEYINLRFMSTILGIVEILNGLAKELSSQGKNFLPVKMNRISYACIQYINKNLSKNITLHELAKELNISTSRLQQAFKDEIGITLHKYIMIQKMQAARNMIRRGMPSLTVAQNLGYEYYSTFFNNYVKRFGEIPKSSTHSDQTINIDQTVNNEKP